MRVSRYSQEIKIDDKLFMWYNALSRKYCLYPLEQRNDIRDLIENINKGLYSTEEIGIVGELLKKQIIVRDAVDELAKLQYLENNSCFQDNAFHLIVYATNACNFRCTYCVQEHAVRNIQADTTEHLIKLIEKKSKKVKAIHITWFGGEPLLQYDMLKYVMEVAQEICRKNHCDLQADMVTNGYLLNEKTVSEMKELSVDNLQITLDGNPMLHNKRRILANGDGTYERIMSNIQYALRCGMKIILRINIDEENMKMPFTVLEEIPEEYRENVTVNISNIFQNIEKISTYELYRKVIEMGYYYGERQNVYAGCIASMSNSAVVDVDGNILLCPNTRPEEPSIGVLGKDGVIHYKDYNRHCKIKMVSAVQNENCRNCKELPFCIASCKYKRMRENTECMGKRNDGLSFEEHALLDYYYDKKTGEKKRRAL